MQEVRAGQTVECTFIPSSEGTVNQADITCRLKPARGPSISVTDKIEPDPDLAGSYRVRYETPDNGVEGVWTFRWEHPTPVKIVLEDSTTKFRLVGSALSDP